ncbi:EamA-like transporter family protein [Novipirellula aureliae]|uniref:EamA-like transporter family protein n=2 Tax=Novipirellula aureliae TaxID=2527966 RepID=A0A5C6DVB9_9BACT|nr:EamA-like transporter family protein [Novipirellula aureliae]
MADQRLSTAALQPPVGLVVGSIYGMAAAVLYTAANTALRQNVGLDPFLVAAMKSLPTIVVLGPFVVWMRIHNQTIATSLNMIPWFALTALVTQVVGNGIFQFALGSIGLAATVPITLGALIIGGAIFGRFILGEPVRPRTLVAMFVLIAAVVVLSVPDAAVPASELSVSATMTVLPVWGGVLCAASAGLSYGLFGVMLRKTMHSGVSAPGAMLVSGIVGAIALWGTTFMRIEVSSLAMITNLEWLFLVLGGVFNLSAFIALSTSLKALPVVSVNLINASQVAMAAVVGVTLFGERITWPLLAGIILTFLGLVILATGRGRRRDVPE